MRVTEEEKNQLSDSIDKMNEALDIFIQLYNESEVDEKLIEFSEETTKAIRSAISVYGKETVEKKINTIIHEIFSFIKE
ncbi:protein mistic [Aeribacillus alveayuensis]|uniref:Atypical membrane-integrating protein (Mistic protein) n=1 Tax=Aeribacillus alveayuensis TaxID=279215 RepID=A0ABT9VSB8_9BACI|nr:hypothetical protein [Bacillus alveayuensis]